MRTDLRTAFDESQKLKNWRIAMPSYEEMESLLHPNEEVLVVVKTSINRTYVGVAILTNKNIHLLGRGTIKAINAYNESFPLSKITGVSRERELAYLGWTITISRASNVDRLLGVDKGDSENFVNTANRLLSEREDSGQSQPVNQALDPLDQIKKLKDLYDSGVLTTEEFESKKQSLLGKI